MSRTDLTSLELKLNQAQKQMCLARSRLAKQWRALLFAYGANTKQASVFLNQMDEVEMMTDGLSDIERFVVANKSPCER